jgi:hypothetical protein
MNHHHHDHDDVKRMMLSNKESNNILGLHHSHQHHVRNHSETSVANIINNFDYGSTDDRKSDASCSNNNTPLIHQTKMRYPGRHPDTAFLPSWKPHLKESTSFSAPNSGSKVTSHPTISSWVSFSQKLSHGLSLSASWAGHNLLGSRSHHYSNSCQEDDSPSYLLGQTNNSFSSSVFYDGLPVTASGTVDILKVPADDVASQLTLIDLPIFQSITREELLSLEFNSVKKHTCAPNIVAFTRRFNQISFWIIEQVLLSDKNNSKKIKKMVERQLSFSKARDSNRQLNNRKGSSVTGNLVHSVSVTSSPSMSKSKWHRSLSSSNLINGNSSQVSTTQSSSSESDAKFRAQVICYFIKVAKKLLDMNNLHSCYAILSALNSSPIYRLNKTWSHVPKKDKQSFDKMLSVFSDDSNFEHLRLYLSRTDSPCIPYLGMFLRDLVYVDIAHPIVKNPKSLCKTISTSSTSSLSSSSTTTDNHYDNRHHRSPYNNDHHNHQNVNDTLVNPHNNNGSGLNVTDRLIMEKTSSPRETRNNELLSSTHSNAMAVNGLRLDSSSLHNGITHHHNRVKDDIAYSMSINTARMIKMNKILESLLKYQNSSYGKASSVVSLCISHL